jgi:hypothetical protein
MPESGLPAWSFLFRCRTMTQAEAIRVLKECSTPEGVIVGFTGV